ncbi:natural killer cells antigen CD94-like [Hyperolius riggenbachi]|uniref:natural killer cells antigen CD94-like n=1 Tax=Hyperolius riggenbachi TaxID=752182 RepID=UPI0035A3AC78
MFSVGPEDEEVGSSALQGDQSLEEAPESQEGEPLMRNDLQKVPSSARLRKNASATFSLPRIKEEPASQKPGSESKKQSRFSECWKSPWCRYGTAASLFIACVCILVLSAHVQRQQECECLSCPNKWTRYNQTCYFVSKRAGVWKEGQQLCSADGGSLLILDDAVQQQIDELFALNEDHWIGLKKDPDSTDWRWLDGSVFHGSVKYGTDPRMSCAYINKDIGALDCSSRRLWICMKQL